MSQSLVGVGLAVNFGFAATSGDFGLTDTIVATGAAGGSGVQALKGHLLQRASIKTGADVESVRALKGDTMSQNYYDLNYDAQLMFVISAAGIAASITATKLSVAFLPGTIINISACANSPDLVGSNWIVQPGAEIPQEITKSAEISLPLKRFANITAAQAA